MSIKRLFILLLALSLSVIAQSTNPYDIQTKALVTLDQEYSNCGFQTGGNLTMITCASMNYLLISSEIYLPVQNVTENGSIITSNIVGVRESLEMVGSMTFVTNQNEVYTARVNSTGKVEQTLLLKIPFSIKDTASVIDVIVTENFTVVRYDNFTVATYLRPKVLGGNAMLTRTGLLNQPTSVDSAVFAISPFYSATGDRLTSNQSLQLAVVQNQQSKNMMMTYAIIQTYSAQGLLLDVPIKLLTTMNLQSLFISAIQISQSSILLGCAQCNVYKGRLDIYSRLALGSQLMKMGQIDGATDNQMLGIDIQVMQNGKAMDTVVVVSNSGGSVQSRQNYLNILRLLRTLNTTNNASVFTFEFTKQVVNGLVATPQSGVLAGAFSENYLLFKYGYSKVVYGATICGYGEIYNPDSRLCSQCSEKGFQLYYQTQGACNPCNGTTLDTSATTFQQSIYNEQCVRQQTTTTPTANTSSSTNTTKPANTTQNSTIDSTSNSTANSTRPINGTNTTTNTSVPTNQTQSTNTTSNNTQQTNETEIDGNATSPSQNQTGGNIDFNNSTNGTIKVETGTTMSQEQKNLLDKLLIPIVVVSVLIAIIFASVLTWCCFKKARLRKLRRETQQKYRENDTFQDKKKDLQLNIKGLQKDEEAGKSIPTHQRAQTNEDLLTQVDTMRGVAGMTPSGFVEGATSAGMNNDRNYNTDELRKEVDREVAQIKAFFMPIEESKTPSKVRQSIGLSHQQLSSAKKSARKGLYKLHEEEEVSDSTLTNKRALIASNVKAGSNSKRNKKGLFAELEESSIAPPPLLGGGALQNVFTDESQENNNNMMIFQQHPTARTELPDTNRMIFEGSTDKKEQQQASVRKSKQDWD